MVETIDQSIQVNKVVHIDDIIRSRQVVNTIYMDEKVKDYIVSLVYATRDPEAYGLDLKPYIQNGASPRATINLKTASKALAFLQGRGYVTPEDVKSIAMDVLRHRVRITYEAEAEALISDDIVQKVLDTMQYLKKKENSMDTHISSEILKKVRQVEIKTNRLVDDTLAGHYHSVFKGARYGLR